jgi:tetratricopeptide (TPR) repeat protein
VIIKNMKQLVVKFQLVVMASGMLLLCGCGQGKTPEPPLAKNQLIIDAMQNIHKQSHGAALARLKKLKVIYPNNSQLLALSETEYDNIFILKIQSGLNQGNIDTALSIINRAEQSKPLGETLLDIKQNLITLKALNDALLILEKPRSADKLNDAIKELRQLIKKYPEAKSYSPLVAKYEKFAKQMALNEDKNAKLDLAADLQIEKNRTNPDQQLIKVLTAQIAVENNKK